MAFLLEVEPLDLGTDVRAVGLELVENNSDREPVRGKNAAAIWSRVLSAVAATEPWGLDFFSHLDRLREYCERHKIAYREASGRSIVIRAPDLEKTEETLPGLLERFEDETFGARAGERLIAGDTALEGELARHGVDAYHPAFPDYLFCGVCNFEEGSLVLLSNRLWASEIIRRIRPVLTGFDVEIRLPV
jgi:hypothetical protein